MGIKKLIELINKKEAGSITLAEWYELNQLLKEYPQYEAINNSLQQFLEEPLAPEGISTQQAEDSFERLHARIANTKEIVPEKRNKKVRYLIRLAVAASIFVGVGWAVFALMNSRIMPDTTNDNTIAAVTKKGSKSIITLPDGTKVIINADTKLYYQKEFSKTTRDVFLQGEAFFDVVKDKKHPFVVHTKAFNVKVLGTAFNVRSYNGEQSAQATLIRGAIEVELKQKSGKTIFMKPNEKIVVKNIDRENPYEKGLPEIFVTTVEHFTNSAMQETAWTQNKLIFKQDRFEDIARELERWYGVQIKIKDVVLKDKTFSGMFENKSVNEVLEALQIVAKFNYTYKDNVIEIR
jgi:ferric-dicitrate binding protein FerR (iron transport regulator)